MSEPLIERRTAGRTFAADLTTSARTLVREPKLILLTFGLHLAFGAYLLATDAEQHRHDRCIHAHPASACQPHAWLGLLGLIYFGVSLFLIGFYGTQRIWFLRAHRGEPTGRSTIWRASWSYFGRFATTGFVGLIFIAPVGIIAAVWASRHGGRHVPGYYAVAFYLVVFVLDVLGTFVGPALAFSTRRVWAAIPTGIRMLVRTWPRSFFYAIAPPVTLLVIGVDFVRRSAGIVTALMVSVVVSPLLGLWAKSATALFYVGEVGDIGPDGSAYFARRTCRNGHPVDKLALYCPVCGVGVNVTFYPG